MSATTDLRTIITEGATVQMVYRRADGDIQERTVDVERVWTTGAGITAFMGFCRMRQERRTFTMDRKHVLWVAPAAAVTVERFGPDPLATPDALAWLPILCLNGLEVAYA